MNRTEAEDYIYKSYLKAEKYQKYDDLDSQKRNPLLSKEVLREMCVTPSVVVTGSKGKGSVACMISQILQTKIRVGLLTSPHIIDFCERFKVNGKSISEKDFIKHVEKISPIFDKIDNEIPLNICISPIAIQAALALSFFKEQNTVFNIFECGKGAKYDDVNNIKHDYAVINSIFLEHTRELGDSIEKIAEDKSHVITGEQKCIYVAQQQENVLEIIKERANKTKTKIKVYGDDFYSQNVQFTNAGMLFDIVIGKTTYKDIVIPLLGEHQTRNCALAMTIAKDILGEFDLTLIKHNLALINWPGRMEVLNKSPFIMLDACINRESCYSVKNVINFLNLKSCTIIVGIPDDKDYYGVVKTMSNVSDSIILTGSQNPHYKFSLSQKENLQKQGYNTEWTSTIIEAIRMALNIKKPIIILGTTSVIAEVKKLQKENKLLYL